jgi:hypothetical protein
MKNGTGLFDSSRQMRLNRKAAPTEKCATNAAAGYAPHA